TTSRDRDHYVEQQLALWADVPADQRQQIREAAEATPLAKTFPAFRSALADSFIDRDGSDRTPALRLEGTSSMLAVRP
ncbi:MAG: hypothetical protein OXF01_02435, partial [Gemmatimonadetes bacterium]|nr:hypothetical protein [Gemmatimonadota bacterium]